MRIIPNKDWNMKIKAPLIALKPGAARAIALHHMAHPTADIHEVERWHLNQGWRAFGYNYWIGFDGTVYEGRGYGYMGAGVANQNDYIISIGFQGNYQSGLKGIALSAPMPGAQLSAGAELIAWLMQKVPSIQKIGGHKDFMPTACPGDTFPLSEMIFKSRFPASVRDCTNELLWRGIITDQPLWDKKAAQDDCLRYLMAKYYPYILKNGGSVKTPLSVNTTEQAVAILKKQGIITDAPLWQKKALYDRDIYWLLVKMADYIN